MKELFCDSVIISRAFQKWLVKTKLERDRGINESELTIKIRLINSMSRKTP